MKGSGKQKKVGPPPLCMQDELDRDNAQSIHDGTTSMAASPRSSAHRAVEEAAEARTVMLQAEAETKRALARFADTRAECNEQHEVMAAEFQAMQSFLKDSLRATNQQNNGAVCESGCYGMSSRKNEGFFPSTRFSYGSAIG